MKLLEALPDFDSRLLTFTEGRKALAENDPLMFAFIYLRHHLKNQDGSPATLCDFHLDIVEWAKGLIVDSGKFPPKHFRDDFIAPRNTGKSTWMFLIIPLWAGAFGHKKFIAAFSDSETQAEQHLMNFKMELIQNEFLRADFPDFVESMKASESSKAMMNNRNQIMQSNGFIFMAKGADSAALGMKVGALRPDFLLFDDIEKGESNYGPTEIRKRKETLISDLFYLNTWAHVGIVGTTTTPDSLMDQMRKVNDYRMSFDGEPGDFRESLDPDLRWVEDENIKTHYFPAIVQTEDGEVSLWPERWSMDILNEQRHTRDFQKNMMNRPVSLDGGYWDDDDIIIDPSEQEWGNTILSIDPAVTTSKRSDYTGMVVFSRVGDKIYVRHAEQVKLNSEALRQRADELIEEYGVGLLYIETNQGGDLWTQIFKGVPCKFRQIKQKDKKEVRAGRAHDFYTKNKVRHAKHFASLEEQMMAFPAVPHDDLVDALSSGVLYYLGKKRSGPIGAKQINYLEDN